MYLVQSGVCLCVVLLCFVLCVACLLGRCLAVVLGRRLCRVVVLGGVAVVCFPCLLVVSHVDMVVAVGFPSILVVVVLHCHDVCFRVVVGCRIHGSVVLVLVPRACAVSVHVRCPRAVVVLDCRATAVVLAVVLLLASLVI